MGIRPGLFWAYASILAEAGGGVLTVLGLGGPLGPGLLAGDLVVVTIVAHLPQGFWAGGGKVGWEFPVPLGAGALAIALTGNGAWSLDRLLGLGDVHVDADDRALASLDLLLPPERGLLDLQPCVRGICEPPSAILLEAAAKQAANQRGRARR